MTNIRQQITAQLEAYHTLGALKAAVHEWLSASDASLNAFEKALEAHRNENRDLADTGDEQSWQCGEINEFLQLQPLTQEEMIQRSLEALDEHRCTGQGVSHEGMKAWVAALGTDHEHSCP